MSMTAPIGMFDSGVGGLSVARELRRVLPEENILYFADTAYCPYGGRPLEEIRDRSLRVSRFLVSQGAKAIVVACNSASGAALETLRSELEVPVVGMEPAVKPAAQATRNGRVGVMATAATLGADRFDRLMGAYASHVEVTPRACPGLVELVEEGSIGGDEVLLEVGRIVEPLRDAGVDTVVLGCTHYPFLRDVLQEVLGPEVRLVDSGEAVAMQTGRVLERAASRARTGEGSIRIFTSGDASRVREVSERLWGASLSVESVTV